jgi:hypothetical protein
LAGLGTEHARVVARGLSEADARRLAALWNQTHLLDGVAVVGGVLEGVLEFLPEVGGEP